MLCIFLLIKYEIFIKKIMNMILMIKTTINYWNLLVSTNTVINISTFTLVTTILIKLRNKIKIIRIKINDTGHDYVATVRPER